MGYIALNKLDNVIYTLDVLQKANDKSIWYYKGLTNETLPYVLVVNYGVFPKTKKLRNEDVHYIF
ncbi:hypothetical protein [Lysinibacillus sphaericus]|nr:hypothetical protein [Lysinibacillus sphaericus]AMO35282.1 hypothetical protein AR327_22590 [Lysinibacillus sphaericus]